MAANNNTQKMTVDRARAIAQEICEQQGWPFFDPIHVYSGKEDLVITTNYGSRGCNAVITVSKATLKIIQIGFARR